MPQATTVQAMSEIAGKLAADAAFIEKLVDAIDARRKWSMDRMVTITVLTLNFGGLLWGAAKLSAAVENNTRAITANTQIIDRLTTVVSDLEARMRVVEDRTRIRP